MGVVGTLTKLQRAEGLVAEAKAELKKIRDNYILLGNQFLSLTEKLEPINGCYNVGVSNKVTGETGETQGDITDNSWSGFYEWLLGDMDVMGIGPIQNLAIDYIEYAGKENVA